MHNEELKQKIESVLPEGWKFKDFIDSPVKYAGGFSVTCPVDDRLGKTYREKNQCYLRSHECDMRWRWMGLWVGHLHKLFLSKEGEANGC